MYDFFKNIAEKNSCSLNGACSIHPSINALYQVLLSEAREISFYLVKLKEFKIFDSEASKIALEALSIFLINTSFNQQKYLEFLDKLNSSKTRVKEKYIDFCKSNEFPCETLEANVLYDKKMSISELINYSQTSFVNKQKYIDKTKQRLFELITIFARLCAIEVVKIKKIKPNFDEFDFDILRFFALTSGYSIRNEKIIRRIYQFSDYSLKIMEKLALIYQEKYGKKEDAKIKLSSKNTNCILVSGDDLDELQKVIETLDEMKLDDKISVYTNGPLFLAHFYPYFKNNKFLKGHFGTNNAEYDFSVFKGAILITQNFIQKIDSLYRGEIFSKKLISFSKVIDIENDNYKPLIEASIKVDKCEKLESEELLIAYDREKIEKFCNELNNEEIIVISGLFDEKEEIKEYKNKKVIKLNCPLEGDILLNSLEKLKAKNIKTTLFIAQCNLSNLRILLALLNQNVDLNIANCPHALINPHVFECLKEDFKVNII